MVFDNFGYVNSVTSSSQSKKEIDEMLSYCLLFLVSKTVYFPKSQIMWERLLYILNQNWPLNLVNALKEKSVLSLWQEEVSYKHQSVYTRQKSA